MTTVTTRAQRRRQGRNLRSACQRTGHAQWNPRTDSADSLALVEESNVGRVVGLVPVRYARMAQSPFDFFRGSAIVQAHDLLDSPFSGTIVQLCGDCHVMNFGGFGTPERNLIFDINDFDETFPGPWEWDVKRLAVSTVLAARHRQFSEETARDVARATIASYRRRIAEFADMPALDIWYARIDFEALRDSCGSRAGSPEDCLPKWKLGENGQAKIGDNPPFVYHFHRFEPEWQAVIRDFFERYRQSLLADRKQLFDRYRFEDIAVKVVGVGSVGTRCTIALFLADETDPLLLQAKEARRSVLEPPGTESRFEHQGERVVKGQRLMQAASDIFLGWAEVPGSQDYYVRQLRDMKVSADVEAFGRRALTDYAVTCGWALARAHAKGGDAAIIAGYLGSSDRFDNAVAQYASAYADQVERDYAAFLRAIRAGRFATETGDVGSVEFSP
jgi:uncharacterized protein (DUF2252 family)